MAKSPKYSDPEVLAKVAGLTLRARHVVEGTISGLHRSPFHGFNVEFAEYREYSPGDDLRRLDWRVFGRTDRYYIKQFEEESNLRCDDRARRQRLDALRLGADDQVRLRRHRGRFAGDAADRASKTRSAWPCSTARSASSCRPPPRRRNWCGSSANWKPLSPTARPSLVPCCKRWPNRSAKRGLIIIISDLLTDSTPFYDGLSRLQYRGHEIMVLHVLDGDELELPFNDLVLFHDIEGNEELFAEPWAFRNAYREAMEEFLDGVRSTCGSRGIDYLLLRTDEDLAAALSHYLHARDRMQPFGQHKHGAKH